MLLVGEGGAGVAVGSAEVLRVGGTDEAVVDVEAEVAEVVEVAVAGAVAGGGEDGAGVGTIETGMRPLVIGVSGVAR